MIKQIVEDVVKSIVDFPDLVEIQVLDREDGKKHFAIKLSDRDLGKVIGREGRTIKAIRTLVHALSQEGQEITVDIAS